MDVNITFEDPLCLIKTRKDWNTHVIYTLTHSFALVHEIFVVFMLVEILMIISSTIPPNTHEAKTMLPEPNY